MANERDKQAQQIADWLAESGDQTVDEIAAEHGISHEDAVVIIDEYLVTDTGKAEHQGPGRGGGWVR